MTALIIFWFPIIGSIFVGSIAFGYWVIGNKRRAIQWGIPGGLMLLITASIQIWQYKYPAPAFRAELIRIDPGEGFVWNDAPDIKIGKLHWLLYLTLTNQQSVEVTISSYRIEGAVDKSGPWTALSTAPTWATVFFVKDDDHVHARRMNVEEYGLNFKLLNHSIGPGETVPGWVWITQNVSASYLSFIRLEIIETCIL